MLVLVERIHRKQAQPVADRAVQRNTQITRGVANHERHQLRGGLLGRKNQIALVLTILIINDDDGLARCDVGNRPFDGVQSRHRCRLPVSAKLKGCLWIVLVIV